VKSALETIIIAVNTLLMLAIAAINYRTAMIHWQLAQQQKEDAERGNAQHPE
jgi:hypothetical protein